MSDLVKRLRSNVMPGVPGSLHEQAADRIEALEAERDDALAKGAALFWMIPDDVAAAINMGDVQNKWRELLGHADRIEALEFEVEHERYNVEKTAQEAAKRIKALEAALKEAGEMWIRKDDRIAALESALREIKDQHLPPYQSSAIAKAALEYKSPIPVKPGVNAV